jgi:hypothetical protein
MSDPLVQLHAEQVIVMFKLIMAAALVSLIALPMSAAAQTACQQHCLKNDSGRGQNALYRCEQRCAVYGTPKH